ncbi:hypothetical protein CBR_g27844 [Chara braunii]|uniref:Integrase catalytic domain-containing protein n=1 Tax=Chara braunii TaxID=69332 RepID=A0A388L8M0_CHABU|nr:hypothetical protein CBR_g27844 [Chara braunii]|eukprot:GBG78618.1 hypothetical protein CBR_g27844 [Chara braunii]
MRFCQLLSKDEKEGIVLTTIHGEVFDYEGNLIDPNTEGGMRKEAFRRMGCSLSTTFRITSLEEAWLAEVEETMASLHINDSPVEPEGFREQVAKRAQTITRRLAQCRDSIIQLCVDVEEVSPGLPNVFLFGEWGDKREDATGQTGTSAPREVLQTTPMVSTMRPRHVLKRSAPTIAVQTRMRRRSEQLQKERGPEKAVEEEPIPVSENDEDNEDERLRAEEEERARRRALEREPEKGKAEVSEEEPRKKKNIYSIPVEQGIDIERLVDKILESQRDLVMLKEILAIGQQEYSTLVDDGAEMNIVRERHAIEAGLKINRDDYGFLVGASGSTPFCETASGVLVTVGKVKIRSYFYVLPRVEHEVLLGRAFLCQSKSIIINKHDGTMFVILCDPVCGYYYEVVKCANTGPYCSRNRLNPKSYTFPESEKLRREKESLEEEPNPRELSLTLPDIGQAIDFVSTHAAIDPNVVQSLTKIITDTGSAGTMRLVYSPSEGNGGEDQGLPSTRQGPFLEDAGLTPAPNEKGYIIDILREEHLAYAFDDDERGRLDVDKIPMIRVHIVPHEPWNVRGPHYPNLEDHRKVVAYLDGKIRTKVADYSYGPYASPWFYFIKPNGTLRWIQDLQKLNSVTVQDAGGLPHADQLSESCAGRSIITLIDLYSGYDQFPIYTADPPKMAMHTPRGLIHMCVALQGWTNAVAIVLRYMIRVMQPYCPDITSPYIDDLVVPRSRTKDLTEVLSGIRRFVWEHINDVLKVLKRLKEFNLTASGIKSRHCMKRAVILGFLCDEKGRRPDVKKTNKILEWPTPFKWITDVRSFLGTGGFWRIFIRRRFILRVDPTALTQSLRNYSPADPTIARWLTCIWMFDFEIERILGSQNRADGLSRVKWHPESDQAEESVPVDAFLKEEESLLTLNSLTYLTDETTRHGRSIWNAPTYHEIRLELVTEESFIEEDLWGEQTSEEIMRLALTDDIDLVLDPLTIEQGHSQADNTFHTVGRMSFIMNLLVHGDRLRLMNADEGGSEVKEAFQEKEYEGEYKKIGMWLNGELDESEVDPVVREKSKGFVVRDGHLFKKVVDGVPKRVVCGTSRQLDVIVALHDGVAGGHRSAWVTLNKIQRLYFWDGMNKMVIDFCKSCFPCQQRSNIRYLEPLNPRYVAEPGAVVHLDLLVMPLGINGYRYIFDARDNLTGFVDGRAIRERTGSVLAECIEEYYLHYPFVQEIVMDRGGEFRAKEVQTLLKRLGDVETKLSTEELLELRARQIMVTEERIEDATVSTSESRQADKERWDKRPRVRKKPLEVGDIVFLYDMSLEKQRSEKLDSRWLGPYRITRKTEHGAYEIEELDGSRSRNWVSGAHLRKFIPRV